MVLLVHSVKGSVQENFQMSSKSLSAAGKAKGKTVHILIFELLQNRFLIGIITLDTFGKIFVSKPQST